MAGFTVADITNLSKEFYDNKIHDLIDRSTILSDYVTKSSEGWDGNNFNVTVHTQRNWGFGARGDDGDQTDIDPAQKSLPTARKQTHKRAQYQAKYMYQVIRLTSPAVARLRTNAGALVALVKSEIDGAMDDARKNQNRVCWHDGSGVLTECDTTSSATTFNVLSAKHVKVGMYIDVIDNAADGAKTAGSRQVTAVSTATAGGHTVTVSGAAFATTTTERVVLEDDRGAVSGTYPTRMYPWGIQALVNPDDPETAAAAGGGGNTNGITEDVGGIDRTDVPEWASQLTNTATEDEVVFGDFDAAFDKGPEAVGLEPEIILTSYAGKRAYADLFINNRRYAPGNVTLQGGYTGLEYNGIGIFPDTDASFASGGNFDSEDSTTIQDMQAYYYLRLSDLRHLILRDWHWADDDGNRFKWDANKDAYIAYLRKYAEFGTVRPNGMGILNVGGR